MGVFMEFRLRNITLLAFVAWVLGSAAPILSYVFYAGALAYTAWYSFLLVKTMQAAVVVPMVWGMLGRIAVMRDLTKEEFFRADAPPEDIAKQREAAMDRLAASWKKRWPKAQETSVYLREHFADLRFKHSGFESMFPIFQKVTNAALDPTCIVARTEGVEVVDVDGQRFLDVSGSYGVNVFGHTRFKSFMDKGNQLAQEVGPCLGPMHSIVADNVRMLMQIFRKEEVSFHMSGTEAIMCAVQQVRFHTERRLLVVFQGTYHGWWDGVMQGAGNENFSGDLLILKDMNPKSIELLKLRASEIAGVLVNPIMGVGWKNSTTSKLGHAKVSAGPASVDKFRTWLKQIREACTKFQIPLIYDEVWAFQLGTGGAQDEYGVDADVVVLGKSLGGGHAVGAVLGSHRLMERRDPQRPMRVSFVVGTFKGSPMVMGSMNAVLKFVTSPEGAAAFNSLKENVARWVDTCNAALSKQDCPISVAAYRNMWTICFHQPSLYQFIFQYYLRDAGIQMVWVGTGKMLFNLEFTDKDLQRLTDILISAAKAFKADGWWHDQGKPPALDPPVPKLVLGPTLQYHCGRLPSYLTLNNLA